MNKNSQNLIILGFAIVVFFINMFYSPAVVTGTVWEPKVWNLDNGSYSKLDNGLFQAAAIKQTDEDFGSASIQQGDMPHLWHNSSARLNKEITVYKDKEQSLYLVATVKRLSPINWTSDEPARRWNNIGLDIMGDVGINYSDTDITQPHALIMDFYHDTDAIKPFYYQGSPLHDNDYRAGYPLTSSRLEIGKEYRFRTRIDDKIRDALKYYNFQYFTIKYTEYYIEAKASSGYVEVRDISIIEE